MDTDDTNRHGDRSIMSPPEEGPIITVKTMTKMRENCNSLLLTIKGADGGIVVTWNRSRRLFSVTLVSLHSTDATHDFRADDRVTRSHRANGVKRYAVPAEHGNMDQCIQGGHFPVGTNSSTFWGKISASKHKKTNENSSPKL